MSDNSWKPTDDIEDEILGLSDCMISLRDYKDRNEDDYTCCSDESYNIDRGYGRGRGLNQISTTTNTDVRGRGRGLPISPLHKAMKNAVIQNKISSVEPKMDELITTKDILNAENTYADNIKSGNEITEMLRDFRISEEAKSFSKPTTLQTMLDNKNVIYDESVPILLNSDYFKFKKRNEDSRMQSDLQSTLNSSLNETSSTYNSSIDTNHFYQSSEASNSNRFENNTSTSSSTSSTKRNNIIFNSIYETQVPLPDGCRPGTPPVGNTKIMMPGDISYVSNEKQGDRKRRLKAEKLKKEKEKKDENKKAGRF